MTGGLMQLVAYGAQDVYLTGNPMITYFKVVYRRHTNFAMETIQQTFTGAVSYGNRSTVLISRNGDLISGMTLEVTLPDLQGDADVRWTDDIGHHLIKEVDIEIGGQLIDRHYSDWLEIWAQLTVPASKRVGYREMIGQSPKDYLGRPGINQDLNVVKSSNNYYIPLQFWFCRNVGLSLPLIALQYHEVKVHILFESAAKLVLSAGVDGLADGVDPPTFLNATLWVDYIYLDTDERRRFAQVSHEYLIEQLQLNEKTFSGTSVNIDLTLNHPVKELIWVVRFTDAETAHQWSNYSDTLAYPKRIQFTDLNLGLQNSIGILTTATVDNTETLGIGVVTNNIANLTGNTTLAQSLWPGTLICVNGRMHVVTDDSLVDDEPFYLAGSDIADVTITAHAGDAVDDSNGIALSSIRLFSIIADQLTSKYSTEQDFTRPTRFGNNITLADNPVLDAILKLNGHDRFARQNGQYFNRYQTQKHHTCIPASPGINVYSFAIKPEDHQPSGTCNFSRIDNAKLCLNINLGYNNINSRGAGTTGTVKVFATNYNVLRIMSGMGGLAYSN